MLPASSRRCTPAIPSDPGRDPLTIHSRTCVRCGSSPVLLGVCAVCWHLIPPQLRSYANQCASLFGVESHATRAAMRKVFRKLNESPIKLGNALRR
jgi:hypothetical protein